MIVDNGKYCIYRHIRLDKNEPFYIGVCTKKLNTIKHESRYHRAFTKTNRNIIWDRITNKTKYRVEILLESDNYNFILEKEIELIQLYGRIDLGTGTLANLTKGGDGILEIKRFMINYNIFNFDNVYIETIQTLKKVKEKFGYLNKINKGNYCNSLYIVSESKIINHYDFCKLLCYDLNGVLLKGYRNQYTMSSELNKENSETFMSNFSEATSGSRQSWRNHMWRKKKEFEYYQNNIDPYVHGVDNKIVYQYDKSFNLIRTYKNINELKPLITEQELKEVRRVLKKQKQTYGGYLWSFSIIEKNQYQNFKFTKLNTKKLSNV